MSEITSDDVRAELSAWLDENWDPDLTVREWWARLAAGNWAHPAQPAEAGGRGYSRNLMAAVNTTMADATVLGPPMGLGYMLAAPTVAVHGTPEQVDRLVPPILDGSVGWCQLFSEPGAGSDLAGLQTKAVRDGDEWVVTGQKVWTSGGHVADKGMLIARTDVDAPKHQGITYFAIDMDQPGIEVRPLREMTGDALFNEVFLDEARVAHADVIGGLGAGWAVANTTLAVERASLGGGGRLVQHRGVGHLEAREIRHRRLPVQEHLESTLRHLGLVGGVSRHELAPADQVPDCSGDMMLISTGAKKGQLNPVQCSPLCH